MRFNLISLACTLFFTACTTVGPAAPVPEYTEHQKQQAYYLRNLQVYCTQLHEGYEKKYVNLDCQVEERVLRLRFRDVQAAQESAPVAFRIVGNWCLQVKDVYGTDGIFSISVGEEASPRDEGMCSSILAQ